MFTICDNRKFRSQPLLLLSRYAAYPLRSLCFLAYHHILILLLPLPPYIKNESYQENRTQRDELCEFVCHSTHPNSTDIRISRNENEETGNCRVRKRQQRHYPRTCHTSGHAI